MLQSLALRLFVPISIALALASCQQPSTTTSAASSPTTTAATPSTTSPTASPASPKAEASPTPSPLETASPTASPSESPKADAGKSDANGDDKIKQLDTVIKENADYKEMYEATEGVKYITLVSTETCKALNSGVALNTLIAELEKEFDKQKDSLPAEKLAKLKEYTGFVVGGSVAVVCPEHKDKLK